MKDERKPSMAAIRKLMESIEISQQLVKLGWKHMAHVGYPIVPDDEKLLSKYLTHEDVLASIRKAYVKHFNMEEILDLIAFFKTESGKKFLNYQNEIAKQIVIETQEKASKAAAQVVSDVMKGKAPPKSTNDPS